MKWADWIAANPLPYDLMKFVRESNEKYAGMQYADRPQEYFDEYNKQRQANMEHHARFYEETGTTPSIEVMISNPYVRPSGRAWYKQAPNGVATPVFVGKAKEATLTDEERASGIGGVQNQ